MNNESEYARRVYEGGVAYEAEFNVLVRLHFFLNSFPPFAERDPCIYNLY